MDWCSCPCDLALAGESWSKGGSCKPGSEFQKSQIAEIPALGTITGSVCVVRATLHCHISVTNSICKVSMRPYKKPSFCP